MEQDKFSPITYGAAVSAAKSEIKSSLTNNDKLDMIMPYNLYYNANVMTNDIVSNIGKGKFTANGQAAKNGNVGFDAVSLPAGKYKMCLLYSSGTFEQNSNTKKNISVFDAKLYIGDTRYQTKITDSSNTYEFELSEQTDCKIELYVNSTANFADFTLYVGIIPSDLFRDGVFAKYIISEDVYCQSQNVTATTLIDDSAVDDYEVTE